MSCSPRLAFGGPQPLGGSNSVGYDGAPSKLKSFGSKNQLGCFTNTVQLMGCLKGHRMNIAEGSCGDGSKGGIGTEVRVYELASDRACCIRGRADTGLSPRSLIAWLGAVCTCRNGGRSPVDGSDIVGLWLIAKVE